MTEVRLKYLHSFVDRHGHVRYYFRYRGNRWTLPGLEGSLWIAKRTTAAFPGGNAEPEAWQLTSKRGADGKDAR